jgi:hypothetical protein
VGQIQPTEIMFISVSFNSSSQKYANFRVHTYPPREVNPFHTDHAGSIQSDLLLSPPPTFSSCRGPPTPHVLVEHAAAHWRLTQRPRLPVRATPGGPNRQQPPTPVPHLWPHPPSSCPSRLPRLLDWCPTSPCNARPEPTS